MLRARFLQKENYMPDFPYRLKNKRFDLYERLCFIRRSAAFSCFVLAAAISFLQISAIRAEILPIKTYTSADGLIYEGVQRAYQDSRGFIWFCSPVGVSRFDGYGFASYGMEDGLSPNPTITDIVEDADGTYWLGTNTSGIYRFDPRATTDKFVLHKISDQNESANEINRLFKTRGGEIFVATYGGVFRLNRSAEGENKFEPVDLQIPNAAADEKEPNAAFSLAEDAENSLWISTKHGLVRRLSDSGAMINYAVQPGEKTDVVRAFEFDRQNRLWLISEKRNLFVFNPEPAGAIDTRDRTTRVLRLAENFNGQIKQGFAFQFAAEADLNLTFVRPTADGKVWLGTSAKGIVAFDGANFHRFTKANGLSDDRIASLLEDSFGNLWINSGWGAMRLSNKGFTTYNLHDGLANETIFQTFQAANGRIYVVNPYWVINEFDGERFVSVTAPLPPETGWRYGRTLLDRTGDWWFATQKGIYRFAKTERIADLQTAQPKRIYTTATGDLPSDKVLDLFEDSRGNIWISFFDDEEGAAHLTRWERESDTFRNFSTADGLPPKCTAGFSAEDASGNVFFTCTYEFVVVHTRGRIITLTSPELKNGGLTHDIYIDRQGRVWVATSLSGLIKIENPLSENPKFTTYTTEHGLSSNHIQYITEDDFGRIYFVTSRGMDRLEPETGKIKYYTLADGLAAAGSGSAFRAADGNLWLGTTRGLSKFVPETAQSIAEPPIYIGGLRVAGRPQPISALGETEISGLVLEPDERQIQIDFYGLSLATGETLHYQYKLEGADADWSEPSIKRDANYANIAPGKYRFLVRAVGVDGTPSQSPAVVSFTVLRPVWQRWWFLLGASILVGLLAYALFRYRVAQVIKLERVRTRIATDLHDDLGASLSKIAILSEIVNHEVAPVAKSPEIEKSLTEIAGTSREMIDSMADIVWVINPERDRLRDLIGRMRILASEMTELYDIGLKLDSSSVDNKDLVLGADLRREIYMIFKETMNNLVKHSNCDRAEIEFRLDADEFVFTVKDDGQGFDPNKNGNGATRGGNGLINMRKRAENLGGNYRIESEIGAGTTSVLRVPLRRKFTFSNFLSK